MLNTPFPPWPSFTSDEAAAISRVLLSNEVNYWTGEEARQFERAFAEWSGASYSVALNNGTVALEAALRALRLGPGDEVIVSPRSFIASVSCVISVGAVPVFADVDRDTQNISAESIEAVLTPRTRAVLPVHLAGMPCDMDPILELARHHDLFVIEDCAQAHGATYRGKSVGAIGDIGAWSFCQDKIITTGGEGGMITTSSEELWSRVWSYKDHGKSWHAVHDRAHPFGFRWQHESFGTNGRMLEVQAAIGRMQLRGLAAWTKTRRANAERIWDTGRELRGLRAPRVPDWAEHGAYRAYVFVEPQALAAGWSRDRVLAEINRQGVPCNVGSCPEIYLEGAFESTPFRPRERLPNARELGETSMMFLVHPTLEQKHMDHTCDVLTRVMRAAVA